MTTIASICERWAMKLEPPPGNEPWFMDWVLRSPKGAGEHLAASWAVYQMLGEIYSADEIRSAREYFGGMGGHALMIQELFHPNDHVVLDYSPDAVEHLRRVMPDVVTSYVADSYHLDSVKPADLQAVDCGDGTAWRTRDGETFRLLLDRVFATEPKAVTVTDIAAPRLHLQRERYETLLGAGTCTTYETYLEAFASRLGAIYGYTMVGASYHRWSTVMAFVPNGVAPRGGFTPTPHSPVGLELL